ncbi:transposase [Candidatus Gottesmanbacteria bacterium]|nr:transposase [Candidatus Gottesmanbacteria bacterium]
MPAKYRIKSYTENSYFHLYNRGVEKRSIFLDDEDYAVLFSYLKSYLLPKDEAELYSVLLDPLASWREKDKAKKLLRMNNFYGVIKLHAVSLMPNHFHFLLYQTRGTGIDEFMNSLWTRYTMYFNKKYDRVGTLFQSVYKAVQVMSDDQLLHLSRYIHRNIIAKRKIRNLTSQGQALRSYSWSSYKEYVGMRRTEWIDPSVILGFWNTEGRAEKYENFVLEADNEESASIIAPVII